jgi:7-cyano-7-deazaguanine synthase in queuosine biosynthesis
MQDAKVILCYSGGLDSTIAKYYLKPDLTIYFALNTKYTQKELKNLPDDVYVCDRLNLKDFEIGDKAYIPFRNLYLVMLAYSEALKRFPDAKEFKIIIVGVKGDNVEDKSPEAFKLITNFLNSINKPDLPRVSVESPFWNKTKGQLVKEFKDKIDFSKVVSCYSETEGRCGECPACFRFWIALESQGIESWNWFNKDIRKWEGIQHYIDHLDEYDEERQKEIKFVLNKYGILTRGY